MKINKNKKQFFRLYFSYSNFRTQFCRINWLVLPPKTIQERQFISNSIYYNINLCINLQWMHTNLRSWWQKHQSKLVFIEPYV